MARAGRAMIRVALIGPRVVGACRGRRGREIFFGPGCVLPWTGTWLTIELWTVAGALESFSLGRGQTVGDVALRIDVDLEGACPDHGVEHRCGLLRGEAHTVGQKSRGQLLHAFFVEKGQDAKFAFAHIFINPSTLV